jgi:hypothetical protein
MEMDEWSLPTEAMVEYGKVVERVEVDSFARTAEGAHDFMNQIGRGVGDADAETDARAHGEERREVVV